MKRWVSLITVLYCLRSDGVYVSFQGMDQPSVDAMLLSQSQSCQYMTAGDYSAAVSALAASQQTAQAAQQAAMAPYQVELATTSQSLIGKTTGYVAGNAISQVNINAKLARIAELRRILGLQ